MKEEESGLKRKRTDSQKIQRLDVQEQDSPNRDFLGIPLHIGDEVAFMQVGYRGLMKGRIISLSAQKARISHEMTNTCRTETAQFCDQIIKIQSSTDKG